MRGNPQALFGKRPKRTGRNPGTAPQADSTIDGKDPGGLGVQELPPGGARAAGRRVDSGGLEDLPDGGGRDLTAEACQLAADPPVAPGRVARVISSASRRITGPVRGRPGARRGWVQWRQTRSACQRRSVRGVTIRASWWRCAVGSRRVRAAMTARSAHDSQGELTWRCRTAIWWRSTWISLFLTLSERGSRASQPHSRTKTR